MDEIFKALKQITGAKPECIDNGTYAFRVDTLEKFSTVVAEVGTMLKSELKHIDEDEEANFNITFGFDFEDRSYSVIVEEW